MKYLMITADDFGMDKSVNDAVYACVRAGVVLSTNVMTNMEYAYEARSLKKDFPFLSVGIHYNFTVGKPISSAEDVPSLIDQKGEFLSYRQIRERESAGHYKPSEVVLEMERQYRRFVEIAGYEPDYWNTHENVHVNRELFHLFRDTSKEWGITRMRNHNRLYVRPSRKNDRSRKWLFMEPFKRLVLKRWEAETRRVELIMPDGLLLYLQESDKMNPEYYFGSIRWGKRNFGEMAIHPSTKGDCRYFGEITSQRVWEYETYSNPQMLEIARANGVKLCNFCRVSADAKG